MGDVTLRTIAERGGVSVATVSLALRGRGMVARETAERIRKLARELGYRPNPLLASLAGKQFRSAKAVGGVPLAIFSFPILPDGPPVRPEYAKLLEAEARRLGYAPKIYKLTKGSDSTPVYRELYHRMAQGIVIEGSLDTKQFGQGFDWGQFSVVQCGRYQSNGDFHCARPNIFQAVKMAFMQLQRHGYKRIGFALGRHPKPMEDDEARYGAAISLESNYLPKRNRLPIYTGNFQDQEAFVAWFKRCKPEAVVGFTIVQYWALLEQGVRIPEDVAFVGLHLPGKEMRGCSGLIQNKSEIARQSVLLLDQMIRNRERGQPASPLNLLVSSIWNEGATVRLLPET